MAIKEASGDFSNIVKMMDLTDGKLDLYSGNDDQIVPLMSLGGKGVISVLSNVAPQAAHDICQLLSGWKGERKSGAAVKGIAINSCIVLRSKPDSGKESGRTDGPMRRNRKSTSDRA